VRRHDAEGGGLPGVRLTGWHTAHTHDRDWISRARRRVNFRDHMATSEDCNDEWERGYIDGWTSVKATTPTMPARPASAPPGVDPLPYFYEAGKRRGIQDATNSMKRI
jgi:hypothetical protein